MGHPILFWSFAALSVLCALSVILARHPVYAVLGLVGTLFALSALFAGLQAYFVAIIQILIYAGAILVLFLFVVMLLDMSPEAQLRIRWGSMGLAGLLFGGVFLWELIRATQAFLIHPHSGGAPLPGTTAAVGKLLFTTYALPFEVASLLLLVGVIGAVVLAKKRM